MDSEDFERRFAGLRVLIAEDEENIRRLLQIVLSSAGFEVIPTADGQEALELARQYQDRIDLLITNVKMPRLNGVDLANHVRVEQPHIKVLIISGETSGQLANLSKRTDFLAKPFVPQILLAKIHEVLQQPLEGMAEI